ncbi:MAG: peptidoglycan DD-metalloendopeptidase family protein [Candidatus Rifleibacteriota bacterium]
MNRLSILMIASLLVFQAPVFAGTNPFSEEPLKIDQSATEQTKVTETAVETTKIEISRSDLEKAIEKLQEANENYSKLLKEFAKDPNKFGDEKGDYRGFIKQLEQLSKKLTEISEKLKQIADKMPAEKKDEKKDGKEEKIVEGTVRVNPYLNVRTGPWGKIIGKLYDGDKVKIAGKQGDWYKIQFNGQTAFIHANYVDTPDRKAGTTPVKQQDEAAPADDNSNQNAGARGGGLTAAPCSPMPGRASSEYGWRIHPTLGTRRFHNGIDLPVPNGTRLNALGNGTVVDAGYESGGGRYVKVRYDNGYESFYCHLKSYSVRKGQRVNAGQEIARSDNTGEWTTGPHLHFALKKNGQNVNPRSAGIPLPR